jgi:hypothetical protein
MNWQRIWTGTAIATLLIALFDFLTARLGFANLSLASFASVVLLVEAILQGFFCSYLYAVARRQLGPGPKTAVIIGSMLYLIKYGFTFIWMLAPGGSRMGALLYLAIGWTKLVAATYLAGWQYIERAP